MTQIEINRTGPAAERSPRGAPAPTYWLIAKNENGRIEVLTLHCGAEKMLPVFGHEEEAEMFLVLGGVADDYGWQATESSAGELVSVLYGPCAEVNAVALDPLPEMLSESTVGLVSLPRERFIERIMARGRPSRSRGPDRDRRRAQLAY